MKRIRDTAFLLEAVKKILLDTWDPIGVNDCEGCRDEYDSYAPRIVKYLEEGVDEERLIDHLANLARISMGLSNADQSRHQRAARLLLELSQGGDSNQ